MIGPNLRVVHELSRVHEETPEEDVEPNEEDSGGQSSLIGAAEERCRQRRLKNEAHKTTGSAN